MDREPQLVAQSPLEELGLRAKAILPRDLVKWLIGTDGTLCSHPWNRLCGNKSIVF